VACALAVVLAVASGLAMLVFEATIRVKENIAIYETGARNAVAEAKRVITHVFGRLPPSVVDEITENALSSGKAILSELLTSMLSYAGKILVGFAMLSLYVMFWLCTPMPLNSKTERIFRRYLILKGSACVCYGSAVGLLLYMLSVELAPVFGLISFFFSFIPEVGAFIAMMLPMPVILFDSRLEAPFLTLLTATAGQLSLKFVFSNIIEVKLVENDTTMKMHPVITLLAVTFFGFIWGPTGMLLSVPMMAYMKVVILSDLVPPAYRDPVLVLLEGDRKAPERHLRARMRAAPD
jgi:predicted PurR-regulated permease PerM